MIMGDTVLQELLARRLEGRLSFHIQSAILLNGGIFPEATHPRLIQKLLMGPLGHWVARLVHEGRFRKSFSAVFGAQTQPSPAELSAFWELLNYNDGRRVIHLISRYQRERHTFKKRWTGALQKTYVPLRLINGTLDPVSGATMVERYRELMPNPDVVTLDHIGHYPQVEDARAVLAAAFDFWNEHTMD